MTMMQIRGVKINQRSSCSVCYKSNFAAVGLWGCGALYPSGPCWDQPGTTLVMSVKPERGAIQAMNVQFEFIFLRPARRAPGSI